jgi:hypothetical protein
MTRRAYAVARAVAEGTVRKAIKAGKIKPTPDGLIDPDQADQGWLRWLGELPEPIGSRVLDRLDQILAAVTALAAGPRRPSKPARARRGRASPITRRIEHQIKRCVPPTRARRAGRTLDDQTRGIW